MSHHFDTRLATRDPRLNIADAYLFDAAPDRTVMVMTCSGDAALSAPTAFHPAALYEFRFDTTGDGLDDTGFQVRFIDPVEHAENGQRQEFTMHYVTDDDLAVDPAQRVAGKPMFSAELNSPRRVGAVDGFAGLVGDMWAADAFAVSTMLHAFYVDRRFEEAAYANRRNPFARRNVMAIVLEVPNALIGDGQVTMWSSISLYGHSVTAQVSRFGIPLFTQLFLSSWRQPLIERYNQVGPLRDFELFAEPVRRFVAEFSALAGLGRISEPYAAGISRASDPDGAVLHDGIGSDVHHRDHQRPPTGGRRVRRHGQPGRRPIAGRRCRPGCFTADRLLPVLRAALLGGRATGSAADAAARNRAVNATYDLISTALPVTRDVVERRFPIAIARSCPN